MTELVNQSFLENFPKNRTPLLSESSSFSLEIPVSNSQIIKLNEEFIFYSIITSYAVICPVAISSGTTLPLDVLENIIVDKELDVEALRPREIRTESFVLCEFDVKNQDNYLDAIPVFSTGGGGSLTVEYPPFWS